MSDEKLAPLAWVPWDSRITDAQEQRVSMSNGWQGIVWHVGGARPWRGTIRRLCEWQTIAYSCERTAKVATEKRLPKAVGS